MIISKLLKKILPNKIYLILRNLYVDIYKNNLTYFTEIPPLEVDSDLDLLMLELPPRYMPMMPNGIGYVYNILEKCDVKFQVLDVNISIYHKFHKKRLEEGLKQIYSPTGYLMPEEPWDNTNTALWEKDELYSYFWPDLQELINNIIKKRPKAVGISLNGFSRNIAKRFVDEIRKNLPEVIIIVGGYDCVYYNLGPRVFTDFDYMVIGEAELTLPPLIHSLFKEKTQPRDLPGIVSRFDSKDREWSAPIPENLDEIGFPKYQFSKHYWYQTYDKYHLIPIAGSRGCHWGRCRFCAERFKFRKRDPFNVADEIEYFTKLGFHSFHFNESDVNGDPDNLYNICEQVIKRNLKVDFTAQLRIDRRNTKEYFEHLARAGFVHMRFGVDGWNDNLLKLMRKGYNMKLVLQNLKDCHSAGITTTVNMVIGVPGETEEDIGECINNLISCKKYIQSIESFNTLILACGSEYYNDPGRYNIKFKENKDVLYERHPDYVPTDLWYSESPYIDQDVRLNRLNKILESLYFNNVNIGSFAKKVIERLQDKKSESEFRP